MGSHGEQTSPDLFDQVDDEIIRTICYDLAEKGDAESLSHLIQTNHRFKRVCELILVPLKFDYILIRTTPNKQHKFDYLKHYRTKEMALTGLTQHVKSYFETHGIPNPLIFHFQYDENEDDEELLELDLKSDEKPKSVKTPIDIVIEGAGGVEFQDWEMFHHYFDMVAYQWMSPYYIKTKFPEGLAIIMSRR